MVETVNTMSSQLLPDPKYHTYEDYMAAYPKEPTQDDVNRELEEREATNQQLRAAAQARAQERAQLTDKQRLEKLEAFMDRQMHGRGYPMSVDREQILMDLQAEHRRAVMFWEQDRSDGATYRSPASSVVNDVFSKIYEQRSQ